MTTPNNLSRRLFLQRAAVGTMLTAGGSTLLAACASGGSEDSSGGGGGAEQTAENPFGVKAADPLDVVIFKGGYGDDYAKAHEEMYKKKYPETDHQARRYHRHHAAAAAAVQRRQPAGRDRQLRRLGAAGIDAGDLRSAR